MKVKKLGNNETVIETNSGAEILVSYETPVAIRQIRHNVAYRTSKSFSRTTSRHINKFIKGVKEVHFLDQDAIEAAMKRFEGGLWS